MYPQLHRRPSPHWLGPLVAGTAIFILDRLTKQYALATFATQDYVCTPFLQFTLLYNRGITWSFFAARSVFGHTLLSLAIISIIMLLCFHVRNELRYARSIWGEALVLAGAVSNVVDRMLFGGVVDFIDFHVGKWHWPTFNVADIAIVVGIGIIMYKVIRYDNT